MLWHFLGEPCLWLWQWCSQPSRFRSAHTADTLKTRGLAIARLILPLLLCNTFLVLLLLIFLRAAFPLIQINPLGLIVGVTGGIVLGLAISIVGDMTAGIAICMAVGIMGGLVFGSVIDTTDGVVLGITGGIALGIALATVISVTGGVVIGIVLGIAMGVALGIAESIMNGILGGVAGGISFIVAYELGFLLTYYRLLLYPLSTLSVWKAYHASCKHPEDIFVELHRSALYWDERVFLPLLFLKSLLHFAATQNPDQTLKEIDFIIEERSLQGRAARETLHDIILQKLEQWDSLRAIAQALEQLNILLPPERAMLDPRLRSPFVHIFDACRNAARAGSPVGWQAKCDALHAMLEDLERIFPHGTFRNSRQNRLFEKTITVWRIIAKRELETLEKSPEKISSIANPYVLGAPLHIRSSLFVGRRDLVRQIAEALSKQGQHPTFLLYGERRMGKSSTIYQLPILLGPRFISLFFDLQQTGILTSATTLLGTIAEAISQEMLLQGIQVRCVTYEQLQKSSQGSENAVYFHFDRWLAHVEAVLARQDRVLLLCFDEFEQLAGIEQNGTLHVQSLLNWLRSKAQHATHVVFLFSGVHTFDEMGPHWASSFVNVRMLKVSFLDSSEACNLILHPTSTFPGEHLFGTEVVEQIQRVTGCHPFLIQGICSTILETVNTEERTYATVSDVQKGIQQFLTDWWGNYFQDLWQRTDEVQRACLIELNEHGKVTQPWLEQKLDLQAQMISRALGTLQKRDLVHQEQEYYYMAAPLFEEWVKKASMRGQY